VTDRRCDADLSLPEVNLQREITYLLDVAAHEHTGKVLFETLGEPLGGAAGSSRPRQFGFGQHQNGICLLARP
jgi:hypothetical protein